MPSRIDRLRSGLPAHGLDGILIGSCPNIRYLCGFTGSSGALLVLAQDAVLFTDSRYTLQARDEVTEATVETVAGPPLTAAARAAERGSRLGFEEEHLTVARHAALVKEAEGVPLAATSGLVERLRAVKDAGEIDKIAASVRLTSRAFEAGLDALREGAEESEVAASIERAMRRGGARAPAFESIVASGPRSAWPHARASARRPQAGEPVVVDIGAMLDGYASDMTRTVFVGDATAAGARVHGTVLAAVRRAEACVRAGAKASDVDAAARGVLDEAGFAADAYQHGTGHGVGLEVHEAPRVHRGGEDLLAAGMVITIEPGVYVPGWGGVRIEDVVVVEEAGCRVLTETTKAILTV